MLVRIGNHLLLPIMIVFIMGSSIYLNKTSNEFILIGSGMALLSLVMLDKGHRSFKYGQFFVLIVFHYFSHLNWCFPIYLVLLIKELSRTDRIVKSIHLALIITLTYSLIRLSYSELSSYALLVTVTDLLSSLLAVVIVRYIKVSEKEKKSLQEKNNELLRFDILTGLLNYYEFRKSFYDLIMEKKQICLVIIDCYNMKELNVRQGYEQVDVSLKWIADELRSHFKEAMTARYGGGEFALAFEYEQENHVIERLDHLLSDAIPQITNVDLLYAFSFANGRNAQQIIADAEERLFLKKRELWLKREEHIFRADKLKVIGELAAGMAHEIRNPLTTVKGFLQIAERNHFNDMEKYYSLMMSEITRVSDLTSEFLQFSKPHISKLKIESVQFCVDKAKSIIQTEIERKGHSFHMEEQESPLFVKMDPDKIVQVLINLLKNAIEAMHEEGEIRIKTYDLKGYAVIEVIDNGPGIPESIMDKLFNPFFTTKTNGTGLGLAISQKIVQDHGGKIEVNSDKQEGTTFKIYLPLIADPCEGTSSSS